jgi:hypothetical protein
MAIVLSLAGSALRAEDVLVRRGSDGALTGSIISIDDAGVRIRTELGATHLVSWDRVREVRSRDNDGRFKSYEAMADDLWRARSRLERGDAMLAEPLLARWFPRYLGQTNETALVVANGLAYCRIARGAADEALLPALEVSRLRRAGVTIAAYAALPPLFDEATGLAPALAPLAVSAGNAAELERQLAEYKAGTDAVLGALAGLYRDACRQALGLAPGSPSFAESPAAIRDHAGARLLQALVEAGGPDGAGRESARQRLLRELGNAPPWTEAWIRLHVGASLTRESDRDAVRRGMVQLVHLPARFQPTQPQLAALALRRLAEAAATLGDERAAAAFRTELDEASRSPSRAAPSLTTSTGSDRS